MVMYMCRGICNASVMCRSCNCWCALLHKTSNVRKRFMWWQACVRCVCELYVSIYDWKCKNFKSDYSCCCSFWRAVCMASRAFVRKDQIPSQAALWLIAWTVQYNTALFPVVDSSYQCDFVDVGEVKVCVYHLKELLSVKYVFLQKVI